MASVAFAHMGAVSRFILDMLRVKASFQETNIAQFAEGRLSRVLRVLLSLLKFWHGRSGRGCAELVNSRRAQVKTRQGVRGSLINDAGGNTKHPLPP